MMERLEIENFRGLDKLAIEGLARVNVFIGANNVGKTSVLEAIYLLHEMPVPDGSTARSKKRGRSGSWLTDAMNAGTDGVLSEKFSPPHEPLPMDLILRRRGYTAGGAAAHWYSMLARQGTADGDRIRVTSSSQDGDRTLEIGVLGPTRHGVPPLTWDLRPRAVLFDFEGTSDEAVSDCIGVLKQNREKGKLVQLLQQVEPRLVDVDQFKVTDTKCPEAWVDVGTPKLLRLTQVGHGLRYAAALFTQLYETHRSAVLIDEMEAGLHHAALKSVWQAISAFSKANELQIFATTHSYDCLNAVHQAMAQDSSDLAVFRLQRGDSGRIVAVRIDHEALGGVMAMELEVR